MRISRQKIAMDLYDDSFKIQDMIDSDLRSIRTELDEYFSEIPHAPGSPILSHPSLSMDISENTLDSELSDDGRIGWMNSSHMYNVSSDLDSINGLLVNPETALPVSISQLSALSSGTVNVTVTPGKTETDVESDPIKMPVQVITAKTSFVSETESKQSKVSFTIAVPSMPTDEVPQEEIDERQVQKVATLQKLKDMEDSPKSRSRQKQNTKFSGTPGNEENSYPKPAYSYSCLIAMALKNSKTGSLPVNEIYDFMIENFPYFKTAPNGWKNSVRHNLSLNKCFEKIEKPSGNGAQRKGYLWALNPSKAEKMEEELQKWSSRDPAAIRKSMANPERLELIEKGELKKNDGSAGLVSVSVVKKSSSKDGECKKSSSGSTSNEVTNTEFSPLGEPVGMDSSLSDLDLQKGLWENLGDDRLQFVSNSPMSSSSPKNTEPNPEMDEDSLPGIPGTSPSSPTKSFVHAHYIYSHLEKTNMKGDTSLKRELCSSEVEDRTGSVP